jgi:DNA-binding MarR family transcriptional regulator
MSVITKPSTGSMESTTSATSTTSTGPARSTRSRKPAVPAQRGAQPRWLSPAEQAVWRSFIEATQLLMERLDHELQRQSAMPHAYYEVLVRLSEIPDRRLRMSTLADRSMSSRSRLSHAVTRLEEAGWVRRETCRTDRRGQFAVLTDTGFAALEAAAPGHVDSVRSHLFDPLSAQQVKQLGEICGAITARLRETAIEGGDDENDAG